MDKKRLNLLMLTLAVLGLLLSGCEGVPADVPSPQGATAAGHAHSPEELARVLEEFAQGQSGSTILTDQQLRESIPAAESWLKGLEVKPAECGLSITAPLGEQLQHASMAALQLGETFITVASYSDAEQLAQNFDAEVQRNERCSRYTVLKDGQRVAYHLAVQELATEAQKTSAHVLTSSDGSVSQQQVMIKVANNNVMLTVNEPFHQNSQADQFSQLSTQINQLLTELE